MGSSLAGVSILDFIEIGWLLRSVGLVVSDDSATKIFLAFLDFFPDLSF
jgi:hypothetical protein